MVGILVISHGRFAEAMVSSVQSLVGKLKRVKGISIWPRERKEEVRERIQQGIGEVDEGDGVVILTDVYGGTPMNLSLPFLENRQIEVVTGVNLPMLLTLFSYRKGRSLREIGSLVKKSGRRSIILVKALFRSGRGK